MKLNNLARLYQEFGQFQLPDRGGVRAALKMADAYLELEHENKMLQIQKQIQRHSLEFAQGRINTLFNENISIKLNLNAAQAMNYTLVSILVINFIGFGFVAWSLTNMVR